MPSGTLYINPPLQSLNAQSRVQYVLRVDVPAKRNLPTTPFSFSLADITDEVLDILMQLVYKLLCSDQLMLAKLLRTKVLGKHEHRKANSLDVLAQPLSTLHVSSK